MSILPNSQNFPQFMQAETVSEVKTVSKTEIADFRFNPAIQNRPIEILNIEKEKNGIVLTLGTMARRAMLSYPHETSLHLYKPADITVEKVYLHINFWTEDIFRVVFSKDIIKRYCNLTGFAKLPPLWSFGLWMSRNSYVFWDVFDDIAKKIRENDISCDVLHLDTAWFNRDWNCDLKFSQEYTGEVDKGPDQYAGQVFLDNKGRTILISWLPGWKYAGYKKKDIGCMSVPREIKLIDGKIYGYPVEEVQHLLTDNDSSVIRKKTGFKIKRTHRKSIVYEGEIKDLKIIRDGCILEVFVNGGEEIFILFCFENGLTS